MGRYGTAGSDLGQFVTPWGLAVDSQLRCRVADTGNRRVITLQLIPVDEQLTRRLADTPAPIAVAQVSKGGGLTAE